MKISQLHLLEESASSILGYFPPQQLSVRFAKTIEETAITSSPTKDATSNDFDKIELLNLEDDGDNSLQLPVFPASDAEESSLEVPRKLEESVSTLLRDRKGPLSSIFTLQENKRQEDTNQRSSGCPTVPWHLQNQEPDVRLESPKMLDRPVPVGLMKRALQRELDIDVDEKIVGETARGITSKDGKKAKSERSDRDEPQLDRKRKKLKVQLTVCHVTAIDNI